MLMLLAWLLLLASAFVQTLDVKITNQSTTGRTQLGMSIEDPHCVINHKATCPPDCPSDCKELYDGGNVVDGPYVIYISTDDMRPLLVYCDMMTSGGGWTVFQRRINGAVDFYRDWADYVDGFGRLSSEHWLGLHNLHLILAQKNYRLRVDLVDFNGSTPFAEYRYFTVGSSLNKYALGINRYQSGGTAGDSLKNAGDNGDLTNMKFSTRDQDNDNSAGNCAVAWHGGWWYNACMAANLNGNYTTDVTSTSNSPIYWHSWRSNVYPLKSTAMKFRPM